VKRISAGVRNKAKQIVLLLLDVDGVLTDGRIIIDDRGIETKQFHVRDGQGIALLMRSGIEVGIITARSSASVRHRAKELGIRLVRQGVRDKWLAYKEIKRRRGLDDAQIAYVGDDVLDLPILESAGLAVSVADGASEVRQVADWVTAASGGLGAVREVAELLLKSQNKWRGLISKLLEKEA
jgi:3-deoxy-D-manno-octulosonate 8-phosphate phosphatase (KDO 8-P phosphatase)